MTPVSFQLLIDELRWGRYKGQQLPASLQLLLLPSAGLTSVGSTNPVNLVPESPGNEGSGGGSGPLGYEQEGTSIRNPRPIQCLKLLTGENTRGALRIFTLPMINSCVFYKR